MADTPKVRSLIHLPELIRRGQPFEVRTTLGHPMENGLRADASALAAAGPKAKRTTSRCGLRSL